MRPHMQAAEQSKHARKTATAFECVRPCSYVLSLWQWLFAVSVASNAVLLAVVVPGVIRFVRAPRWPFKRPPFGSTP